MENFADACCEMDFILQHLDGESLNKIPEKLKNFFRENKSKNYKVNIDISKNLYEQKLLEETEIFIQIIYKLFIATKLEKDKYIAESRKLFVEKSTEQWLKNKEQKGSGANE